MSVYGKQKPNNTTIALSGAFDPLHSGHIRMIQGARFFGKVVIILNSDEWLYRKNGYVLQTFRERKEILLALNDVYRVVSVDDKDDTVCEALENLKPTIFGNGGFRTKKNTPERRLCENLGIKMVYGIGGGERDQISLNIKEKIINIGKSYVQR